MDLRELYWAAGFLEGEGHFGASKKASKDRPWYFLCISCGQVQEEPLLRLQKLFGGKIYKVKNNYGTLSSFWQLWGPKGAGVMMTLWTLMSSKRKTQIEEAINRWKSNRSVSEALRQRAKNIGLRENNANAIVDHKRQA